MKAIGLFYGSSSGKTEKIALKIRDCLSHFQKVETFDIAELSEVDFSKYSLLIFGVSTWGIGRLQDDWLMFLSKNSISGITNCPVAFFGLGDQDGYPDTFNDGMGILYMSIKTEELMHIGKWPVTGYRFESSKAVQEGKFIGLALDEDNEAGKSAERIELWVSQLMQEFKLILNRNASNKGKV